MKFLSALFAAALLHAAAPLAIRDVSIVDIASSTIHAHMTVVIDGEKIKSVEPAGARIPVNARVVLGTGKFLILGMWDMRVHLGDLENQLPAFLAYGVTGVVDVGSDFDRTGALRAAIESGKAIGPHIVTSGPAVDGLPSDDPNRPVIVARTPDEARKAFDRLWNMDVDFISVQPQLSADAYFALAEQARHWHLRLQGTVPAQISALDAEEQRQSSMAQMSGLLKAVSSDQEALTFFEKCALNEIRITPELAAWQRLAHTNDQALHNDPRLKFVPETLKKKWAAAKEESSADSKRQIEGIYKLVGLATRTKIGILTGTESGDPWALPGAAIGDELEQLVAAGLDPHQALAAATIEPARFLEWDDTTGTIEPGKLADLVLLDANPLVDIKNVRRVGAVFARGKYFSRRELDAMLLKVAAAR